MKSSPLCSIVIRAFNEEKHIGRLLSGITQQDYPAYEVILVDSGSTDRTIDIARQFDVNIVHISPQEFTFGRSLNMGIQTAQGEFIVIISAHCYPVYPDWLTQIILPLQQDKQIAISYGKQRGGKTNQYSEHQWFIKYFPDNSTPRQGHPYCHNANAAIRRSIWEQHPYNENLTGLEDLAWGSWIFEQGYGISYTADAEIIHLHDEKPSQVYNRYRREAIAMKQILPQSKFTFWNFLRMTTSTIFSDLIAAKREGVLQKHFFSIFWFRWMQYWGTRQGYHYGGKIDSDLHQQFYYPPGILTEKQPAARAVQPIQYDEESN